MCARPPRRAGRSAGESGSAYVIALLVLFILSAVGLSLVFITQTEMEIGSNERGMQRVFYTADGGLAIATARVLVANDYRPAVFDLPEPGSTLDIRNVVELAAVVPLYDAPCNLCEINNAGTYQEKAYRKINNAITVRAERRAGRDGRQLGAKTIAAMLELQPWKAPVEAYLAIGNDDQLAQVRK